MPPPPMSKAWLDHQRRHSRQLGHNMKRFGRLMRREWNQYNRHEQGGVARRIAVVNRERTAYGVACQAPAIRDHTNRDASVAALDHMIRVKVLYLIALQDLVRFEVAIGADAGVIRRDTELRDGQFREYQNRVKEVAGLRFNHLNDAQAKSLKTSMQESDGYPAEIDQNGTRWHYDFRPLGHGGQASLGFFLRTDDNQSIADKFVVKDTWDHEDSMDDWWDPFKWHGDVNDESTKRPMEVFAMEQLALQQVCAKTVRLRGWRRYSERLMYRIYMETCRFGDLNAVMGLTSNMEEIIPEPAMWYIFQSLVEAGLLMEQGHLTVPRPGWQLFAHRDIKPINVFLSAPVANFFGCYPEPKLGDFGLTVCIPPNDPNNPAAYLGDGTPGFFAPEQQKRKDPNSSSEASADGSQQDQGGRVGAGYEAEDDGFEAEAEEEAVEVKVDLMDPDDDDDDDEGDDSHTTELDFSPPPPWSSKINVYGVGLTIMTLMNRDSKTGAIAYDGGRTEEPEIDGNDYNAVLRGLVETCVRYNPNDRPTFADLHRDITAAINDDASVASVRDNSGRFSFEDDRRMILPAERHRLTVAAGLSPGRIFLDDSDDFDGFG